MDNLYKTLTEEEKQEQRKLAHMDITDIAKAVRKDLKKEFGKNIKFSVRTSRFTGGQSLDVRVKKATNDCFKTLNEFEEEHMVEKLSNPSLYDSLLERFIRKDYLAIKNEIRAKIEAIANGYNYDNSVIQIDYFDVNYYCSCDGTKIEVI